MITGRDGKAALYHLEAGLSRLLSVQLRRLLIVKGQHQLRQPRSLPALRLLCRLQRCLLLRQHSLLLHEWRRLEDLRQASSIQGCLYRQLSLRERICRHAITEGRSSVTAWTQLPEVKGEGPPP